MLQTAFLMRVIYSVFARIYMRVLRYLQRPSKVEGNPCAARHWYHRRNKEALLYILHCLQEMIENDTVQDEAKCHLWRR